MKRFARLVSLAIAGTAALIAVTPGIASAGTIGASCAVGGLTALPGHVLITSLHGELRKWPDNGTPTTLTPDGSIADRWRLDIVNVHDSSPAAPGGHLLPIVRVDAFTFDITATASAVWPISVTFFHHNIRPDLTEYRDPDRTVTITEDGLPCAVVTAPTTTTTTTSTTAVPTTTTAATTTTPTTAAPAPEVLGASVTVPAAGLPATGGRYTSRIVGFALLLIGTGLLLTQLRRKARPARPSLR
jgi:hypothetical protein